MCARKPRPAAAIVFRVTVLGAGEISLELLTAKSLAEGAPLEAGGGEPQARGSKFLRDFVKKRPFPRIPAFLFLVLR